MTTPPEPFGGRRGRQLLPRPTLEQVHRLHRGGARGPRPRRARPGGARGRGFQVTRVVRPAGDRADRARQVHPAERPAGPQRDALLPVLMSTHRRDDADRLHADGRRGVPAVRPHLPAAPRPVPRASTARTASREILRNWPQRGRRASSSSPTASGSSASATSAPTGWASRSASSRSTPRAPASTPSSPADHARRRHQQRGPARRPALPRAAPASGSTGADYDDFIEEFVTAVQERLPGRAASSSRTSPTPTPRRCWTATATGAAFNDDIQGTAAVALAGILGRAAHHRRHAGPTRRSCSSAPVRRPPASPSC